VGEVCLGKFVWGSLFGEGRAAGLLCGWAGFVDMRVMALQAGAIELEVVNVRVAAVFEPFFVMRVAVEGGDVAAIGDACFAINKHRKFLQS
jgi:hypothetical protein